MLKVLLKFALSTAAAYYLEQKAEEMLKARQEGTKASEDEDSSEEAPKAQAPKKKAKKKTSKKVAKKASKKS